MKRYTTPTNTTEAHNQGIECLQRPMACKHGSQQLNKNTKKQEAGKRERRMMETWVGYHKKASPNTKT